LHVTWLRDLLSGAFYLCVLQIMAASTSGVYTLTMGAAEGMHPDPHQLMELVGKEDLSNFYGDMGAAGSSAIHTLLEVSSRVIISNITSVP
jgi:hypothetical protein